MACSAWLWNVGLRQAASMRQRSRAVLLSLFCRWLNIVRWIYRYHDICFSLWSVLLLVPRYWGSAFDAQSCCIDYIRARTPVGVTQQYTQLGRRTNKSSTETHQQSTQQLCFHTLHLYILRRTTAPFEYQPSITVTLFLFTQTTPTTSSPPEPRPSPPA